MKNSNQRRSLLPLLVIVAFLSASFLSISFRLTNFFFLPSSLRYIIVICSVLLPVFVVFSFQDIFKQRISQIQELWGKSSLIKILSVTNFIGAIFLFLYIPRPTIPINHKLSIETLPSEGVSNNSIQINRIRRLIEGPESGSDHIDLNDMNIKGGNYEYSNGKLILGENAIASYESFFSGSISIYFNTSQDSHKVRVQFDQIQEQYSLYSIDVAETEVQLYAPISLQRLSPKWSAIVISSYVIDYLFMYFVLCVMEILVFLLIRLRNKMESYNKLVVAICCLSMTVASVDQVTQIWKYPESRNTENLPPLKPSVFLEEYNFGSVYQKSIHTKKFAHAFIMNFLDIYPNIENVFIDRKTLDEYGFGSFEFQRWFGAYNPEPIENLHIRISDSEIMDLISTTNWTVKEFYLDAREKTFFINYLNHEVDHYALITNRANQFYILPDTLIECHIKDAPCCSK